LIRLEEASRRYGIDGIFVELAFMNNVIATVSIIFSICVTY
jgi:hypothetical protein